jgi:hypothetical protein
MNDLDEVADGFRGFRRLHILFDLRQHLIHHVGMYQIRIFGFEK